MLNGRRVDWQPKYNSRICSWHFPEGDRKKGPTRFDWNEKKLFDLNFSSVNVSRPTPTPLMEVNPIEAELNHLTANDTPGKSNANC